MGIWDIITVFQIESKEDELVPNSKITELEEKLESAIWRIIDLETQTSKFKDLHKDMDGEMDTLDNRISVIMREIEIIHDEITAKASTEYARRIDSRWKINV